MLDQSEQSVKGSEQSTYLDWNNSIDVIDKAFEKELFVLIIGPKGTGKTSLVREYATQKSIEQKPERFEIYVKWFLNASMYLLDEDNELLEIE